VSTNPFRESLDVAFSIPAVHRLRFTRDVFGPDQETLAELLEPTGEAPARVQFWIDQAVARANPHLRQRIETFVRTHARRLARAGNVQIVPGGERVKNDVHLLERMLKVIHAADLDRRSYIVAIGGGAVLDAVGMAASVAHRGIRLVRLPTTTLGQADSGVGVKTGVNLFGKKNWIGSFAVPWGVVNDAAMLDSLSDRDYRCGFAEAVKVSLLKEPALFERIERSTDAILRRGRAALEVIAASAKLHLAHITRGGDPFESNEARPLDFGHWSAHKLESASRFRLRHGEAVAIGLAIDSIYSSLRCGLPASDANRILDCLARLGFSFQAEELNDAEALLEGMEEFRQHLGGRLTITLLEGVGRPVDVHEIDAGAMREAIRRAAGASQGRVR
jgi:3-dehydroquinate synthase